MMIRNIFILLTVLSMTGIANAATITVDDSGGAYYTKIQDAVNVANNGDTIEVRSGTYYENVNANKQLILIGIDTGSGRPIVDSGGSGYAIILSTDRIRLENFDMTGIQVVSSNNILNDNIVNYLSTFYSSGNAINNNTINRIYIQASNNNVLNSNKISNGGITLDEFSTYNVLRNNVIFNNSIGIWISYFSNNNTLIDNHVSNNSGDGIAIFSSSNNILNGNIVESNGLYGIYIGYSTSNNIVLPSTNNILYMNNLVNNRYSDTIGGDAIDYGGNNQWDNGIDIGNHYSDFDEPSEGCNDVNNNGICDSNYNIPGGYSADRYPIAIGGSGCGNTPSGQNIDVNPSSNIGMTYDNVVQCGNTSVTIYLTNQWSPLPNNYQGISFNDIQTTATYSNDIIVNIAYSDQDISGIDENSIKMFHYENGDWIDVTTSLDIANNKVTGTVNSLSPFAIAGSSSGTPTPTISPTTTPISGGGTVRGSSLNIISVMILTIFLIIVSVLRIRKN